MNQRYEDIVRNPGEAIISIYLSTIWISSYQAVVSFFDEQRVLGAISCRISYL